MSKHDALTLGEFSTYRPNAEILSVVEETVKRLGLERSQLRVLDYGCGRGRLTLHLLKLGYDAFGVDIDPEVLTNAKDLYDSMDFLAEDRLRLLSQDGTVPFSDGAFHVIVSDQVLEHVADFAKASSEIARLTASGGENLHILPAKWTPVELHLFMPFVHWLPKNILRRGLIGIMVMCGIHPRWKSLASATRRQRAAEYYRYSIEKTYYRSPSAIGSGFIRCGHEVAFAIPQRHFRRLGPLRYFAQMTPFRQALTFLYRTFISIEARTRPKAPSSRPS
jgi:SAM-dependent methyltransferase